MGVMVPWTRKNWPLLAAIALLWIVTVLLYSRVVSLTDGRVAFGLDDP